MKIKKRLEKWRMSRRTREAQQAINRAVLNGLDLPAAVTAALEKATGLTRLPGEDLYEFCGRAWGLPAADVREYMNLLAAGHTLEDIERIAVQKVMVAHG